MKDLEKMVLSWIIWIDPKCNHMYPYTRKEQKKRKIHREKGNVKTEHRDVTTSQGMQTATRSWMRQGTDLPLELPQGPLLAPSGLQNDNRKNFRLLVSSMMREKISVVLSHPICGNLL